MNETNYSQDISNYSDATHVVLSIQENSSFGQGNTFEDGEICGKSYLIFCYIVLSSIVAAFGFIGMYTSSVCFVILYFSIFD